MTVILSDVREPACRETRKTRAAGGEATTLDSSDFPRCCRPAREFAHSPSNVIEAGPEYRSDEANVASRIMYASSSSRRIFRSEPESPGASTGWSGEIKSVEKDVLVLETDYSDADFKIKWEKIASIQSDRQFVVETFDGKRISGSLRPDPAQQTVVQVADTSVKLPDVSVVGRVGGAAVRAEFLGAVRQRSGLRLQHDAHQLRGSCTFPA